MIKNYPKSLKLDLKINNLLEEVSKGMDLKESILMRYCLLKTLKEIKAEKIKTGDWKELTISYSLK